MAESDAITNEGGDAFTLPPRRKTILAKYSRRSKLVTSILGLTGMISSIFLITQIVANQVIPEPTKRHAPKVYGADNQPRMNGASNPDSVSSETVETTTVLNNQDDHSIQMPLAPDPDVSETTPEGELPRISEDGRQPWQVYSRPFNMADKRPRLSILISDLGLQRAITDDAIAQLPANVTLAFDVQSPAIGAWAARARQEGHEFLLSIPMEPFDFPRSDPGPHTLLTSQPNGVNLEKFTWSLHQAAGYIGVMTMTGSRFTTETEKLRPIMQVLQQRGLMILDTHIAPHSAVAELAHDMHVPMAVTSERVDENLSPEAIDAAFQQLERAARLNGKAVGIFPPLPIVISQLRIWLKTLPQSGIALAPISAVTQ